MRVDRRKEVTKRRLDVPIYGRCEECDEWRIGPDRDHCACDNYDGEGDVMALVHAAREWTSHENRTYKDVELVIGLDQGVRGVELDEGLPVSLAVEALNILDHRPPKPPWGKADIMLMHPLGQGSKKMRILFARSKQARYSITNKGRK